MQRVGRLLALCGAMILALPPGWCCFALNALVAASAQAGDAAPPVHQCCRTPATPPTPATPAGKDATPPAGPTTPKKACCCQQDVSGPKDADTHPQAPVAAMACAPQPAPVIVSSPPTGRLIPGTTVSLQLIHCVWTC
jgi:hypothetical protein